MAISENELLENLCVYDPRNPCYDDSNEKEYNPDDRSDCYCDSCFRGKHILALEILRLREELKKR